MNVTELARRINILPQELYELLPRYGFDVGRRAIKIDDRLAQEFLKRWPRIRRDLQREKEKAREEEERKRRREAVLTGTARVVTIPPRIAVRDFAVAVGLPVSEVLRELLRNGILANLNEPIDYATAAIIAEDLGCKPEPAASSGTDAAIAEAARPEHHAPAVTAGAIVRPPVVVVMGHVDHGKTSILDAIRKTRVAAGEAGGITQHIGAYQVTIRLGESASRADEASRETPSGKDAAPTTPNGIPQLHPAGSARDDDARGARIVTFIDTPGHEAFTTMRSRGARVADVAVLVVAADDGVQPQTKEALKIIEAARLPFVVAVNKVDKPDADPDRVMQELGALGVTTEAWGGKVPFALLSAKTGQGVDQLLEVLLLIADVEAERLRTDATGPTRTVAIESHVDKQEGPLATLLVQSGTLRVGDVLAIARPDHSVGGDVLAGKVRAMVDHTNATITEAGPSVPVRILGFKVLPEVGDVVVVPAGGAKLERTRKRKTATGSAPAPAATPAPTTEGEEATAVVLPVMLRADVLGSLEALASEVEKIGGAAARAKIIAQGLGNITEADIQQAAAGGATIFGFGVRLPDALARHAREANVPIVTHKIIYEILKRVRTALEAKIPEETIREELGSLRVLALFRKGQQWQVVGGTVTVGAIAMTPGVRVIRDRDGAEGKLMGIQAGKEEVREVTEGQECGMKIGGIDDLAVGDVLKFEHIEVRKKALA